MATTCSALAYAPGGPAMNRGRDPIFFAQLASETQAFHPAIATVQNICLGCHSLSGEQQFHIDQHALSGSALTSRRDGRAVP